MGFFSPSVTCNICEQKVGLNRFKIQDGWICKKCFKKCGFNLNTPIMQFNSERIKSIMCNDEKTKEELTRFNTSKSIGSFLQIDENQCKIKIINSTQGQNAKFQIYNYEDILSCELFEDGINVTKGGLGRALVGGTLVGDIGAIVGSVTGPKKTSKEFVGTLGVKVTVKDLTSPTIYIQIISRKTKTSSAVYQNGCRFADDILSTLSIIINKNMGNNVKQQETSYKTLDSATEIKKFKQLLDEGIITSEEFNAKKKQLLGI
ncbi:DUF4428 domain-containing protein [Clostridium sp. ZBS4]|uniref:DUF4428 domain-containing protein n=1 Tax=Clostridium sp. ZBS4 TaxID=2949974 RepID=UPI0020795A8D|nr:DUF4428 domain-containing protein [Clostridium sp. ZBS4]